MVKRPVQPAYSSDHSMKYLLIFILALGAGFLGGYVSTEGRSALSFGATTARTTITNPWTFQATTTMANVIITTTNAATSTISLGCVQTTATSTATPIKLVIGSIATSSATYSGTNTIGLVGWQYGYCPKLP